MFQIGYSTVEVLRHHLGYTDTLQTELPGTCPASLRIITCTLVLQSEQIDDLEWVMMLER